MLILGLKQFKRSSSNKRSKFTTLNFPRSIPDAIFQQELKDMRMICHQLFLTFCLQVYRVVTKISSCPVNTTSRQGIKQLGISFGSIFLLFPNKSSRGPLSQQPGIPGPRLLMTTWGLKKGLKQEVQLAYPATYKQQFKSNRTGLKTPTGRRQPVGHLLAWPTARGFELATTKNKSSKFPEPASNTGPRDCEAIALITRPCCLL